MAIDAARVSSLIEELGLEGPDKEYFSKVLTTNERAATAFVGQRHRHDDYTKKTQDLSEREKTISKKANDAIGQYAAQLQAADTKIRDIMNKFETESISRATAEARLLKVKETYNLSDDDIPAVTTPAKVTSDDKGLSAESIKTMLKEFKSEFMREIAPELMAFPQVSAIQQEIYRRHRELTGKDMNLAEMKDLMKTSQSENGPNLMQAWREKHGIDKLEKDREHADLKKQWQVERDDEDKKRRSEEAMRGVKATVDGEVKTFSPVIGRKYETHNEPAERQQTEQRPQTQTQQQAPQPQASGPKMTGAERAAQKYIERRQAGIPMGKEAPVGSNQ